MMYVIKRGRTYHAGHGRFGPLAIAHRYFFRDVAEGIRRHLALDRTEVITLDDAYMLDTLEGL